MFIEQINLEKKDFVKYIAGSVAVIFFNILGQIPLTLYVLSQGIDSKAFEDQYQLLGSFPSNTTLFLILIPFAVSLVGLWLVVEKQLGKPFKTIITTRNKIDSSAFYFPSFYGEVSQLLLSLLVIFYLPQILFGILSPFLF